MRICSGHQSGSWRRPTLVLGIRLLLYCYCIAINLCLEDLGQQKNHDPGYHKVWEKRLRFSSLPGFAGFAIAGLTQMFARPKPQSSWVVSTSLLREVFEIVNLTHGCLYLHQRSADANLHRAKVPAGMKTESCSCLYLATRAEMMPSSWSQNSFFESDWVFD